jgi:competence ComEA-like helix-hairpin-helix protein
MGWVTLSSRFIVAVCLVAAASTSLLGADQAPAIVAVAALTDPAKLATLKGERAANDRLHKILAYLEDGRRDGVLPSKTLDEAQKLTGDTRAHAAVVKETILRNFELCERSAVFTPDNLSRMKQGRAPLVTNGTYAGQNYDVDHIIPVKEFPTLGKELANLIYLPAHVNRSKGADMEQRALDLGSRLAAAGVLTTQDVKRLHRIRQWGESRGIASRVTSESGPVTSASPPSGSPTVNLNTASASAIEALPGIGPKTAAKIIAARPLKDMGDLDQVPGIGEKTIESLQDLVSF